jgi:acetate kinase
MTDRPDGLLLTVNSGSSSLKAALYRAGTEALVARGQLDRIGVPGGRFQMADAEGRPLEDRALDLPDHEAALHALFVWLRGRQGDGEVRAVGHRIVHGGPRFQAPQRVGPELIDELRRLAPFDPMHLPAQIRAVEVVARRQPDLPQVACFDTAFHRTLSEAARLFALPRRFAERGVYRYGFHGLSYEYIVEELPRADSTARRDRVLIAHLGNGASMAAVLRGVSVDTTMGFTPTGGLVMGTRSGDLDPGVLLYLLTQEKLSAEDLGHAVNRDGGLLGLSGVSGDMRELLGQAGSNPAAALAVEVFCRQARKFIGALTAALGGLDTLVFTAGIGEKSSPIRERICAGLEWLGVRLDAARNARNETVISADGSAVRVLVVKTNEELMIARHTARVLAGGGPGRGGTADA